MVLFYSFLASKILNICLKIHFFWSSLGNVCYHFTAQYIPLSWSLVGTIHVGSRVLYFLEFSNSAGNGSLWLRGVVLYVKSAKSTSSPSSIVFMSDAFIVWTHLSTIPFDWGFLGDETLCSICHCLIKSLNSGYVYCGPPSETITSGTPSLVKTAFISWTKTLDVVLPSLSTSSRYRVFDLKQVCCHHVPW